MAETLAALLTAHLIADFAIGEWKMEREAKVAGLIFHIASLAVISFILLGALHGPLLAVVAITHALIDASKARFLPDTLGSFAIDQTAHLLILFAMAVIFPKAAASGWWYAAGHQPWAATALPGFTSHYFAALCLASGILLCVPFGGLLISKATKPFVVEIEASDIQGLPNGGKYIGFLERLLVVLLIFINQPAGIGFLITAKSILRFGDVKDSHQRKVTEYIIIGTFLSFGWALLVGVLMMKAVAHWVPF